MEKRRASERDTQNMDDTARVFMLFVILDDISRVPVNVIFFISFAIQRFFQASADPCIFWILSSHFLFSISFIHVRYVRNLAVANSCTNVNAGRDGFTNCFSLLPPTVDPFYVSFFFSLFISLSHVSIPFLSLVSVYVVTSRIAEIPHLFSFSGAVAGRAGRIARTRETTERKKCRE